MALDANNAVTVNTLYYSNTGMLIGLVFVCVRLLVNSYRKLGMYVHAFKDFGIRSFLVHSDTKCRPIEFPVSRHMLNLD